MELQVEAEVERLAHARTRLQKAGVEAAAACVVLGSGLKTFGETLTNPLSVSFDDVPEFPRPRVAGHGGELIQGTIGDTLVHCLTGRAHLYEGWHPWELVRAVRTVALLGTGTFVLTNAAGGVREDLAPGDLMLIRDHLNLTGKNVLCGEHHDALGPRFPPMSEVYCAHARARLHSLDPKLVEGVYCQVSGPSYETPSEVKMIGLLGGDAVGMSTVPEAVALRAMGKRVVGLSLITNRAAGLSAVAPNHEEVIAEGKKAAQRMERLLTAAIPALA